MKKVIISAGGFAVARTTNKAEPAEQCVQQKRPEKKSAKTLEGEKSKTVLISRATFLNPFWERIGQRIHGDFPIFSFVYLSERRREALQEKKKEPVKNESLNN